MEDFLKDRPVAQNAELNTKAVEGKDSTGDASPFGTLERRVDQKAEEPAAKHGGPNSEAGAQTLTGDHGATVKTVVEKGRVTRIIVTCSCGKVTEIGCTY